MTTQSCAGLWEFLKNMVVVVTARPEEGRMPSCSSDVLGPGLGGVASRLEHSSSPAEGHVSLSVYDALAVVSVSREGVTLTSFDGKHSSTDEPPLYTLSLYLSVSSSFPPCATVWLVSAVEC